MKVRPIPFPEKNGTVPFNASGVVRVGARHFVFVDNKDPTALFELAFDARVVTVERIHRRRLAGPGKGDLRDPEGLTRIDLGGETLLIVASSLCVADGHRVSDGLVRVRYRRDGDLPAEPMDGFRDWLLDRLPALAEAGRLEPDAGGLNVEGLTWDAGTLLFGLRGPAAPGEAAVVRIPADVGAARWTTAVLGAPEVVPVRLPEPGVTWGIRDLSDTGPDGDLLVLLGRSAGTGDAPFRLGSWDPGRGRVELLDVAFHRTAKPEGVTVFTAGGEQRILVVDDAGGYAVL
ncbi:DUF3616 domain-containing protein [Amycolatopsis sp. NPDC051102]|uniref:DUF3616 domain-containing protein n=1 Tax=Amycolatopsis sp. NPDC051102 TaxID=3155163 RepID=UPI003446C796